MRHQWFSQSAWPAANRHYRENTDGQPLSRPLAPALLRRARERLAQLPRRNVSAAYLLAIRDLRGQSSFRWVGMAQSGSSSMLIASPQSCCGISAARPRKENSNGRLSATVGVRLIQLSLGVLLWPPRLKRASCVATEEYQGLPTPLPALQVESVSRVPANAGGATTKAPQVPRSCRSHPKWKGKLAKLGLITS